MTLEDAERKYGFKYPEKLHKIRDMGALEWMEIERGKYSSVDFSKLMRKYAVKPNQFMMISCDVEPILFCDLEAEINHLYELVSYKFDDEGLTLKYGVRLIPFAKTGGGDYFCFIYTDDIETAKIGWYYHDAGDTPDICAENFEDFLFFSLLNSATYLMEEYEYGEESDDLQFFISLLSDEYKAKVEGKTLEELADDYDNRFLKYADIWEKA